MSLTEESNQNLYDKAICLLEEGQLDASKMILEKLEKLNFRNSANFLSFILIEQEEFEAAIPYLEKAIVVDNSGSAHFSLAHTYQKLGNKELAIKFYLEANRLGVSAGMYRIGKLGLYDVLDDPIRQNAIHFYQKGFLNGHIYCEREILKHRLGKWGFLGRPVYLLVKYIYLLPKTVFVAIIDSEDERIRR